MFRALSSLRNPIRVLPQTFNSSTFSSLCSNPNSISSSIKLLPIDSSSPSISSSPSSLSILSYPFSSSSKQKNDEEYDSNFVYNRDPKRPPNLFVVQPRIRPEHALDAKLSEALNLAHSLEEEREGFYEERELPPHVIVQNPALRSCTKDTYFGPGTVDTVKCHINAVESKDGIDGVDAVFVNAVLTAVQQRNLERAWGKPVLDRVGLIIEIFNAHAQTKEAKLQSELAALMYKRTRLVRVRGPGGKLAFGAGGEAEVVSARGRGSGGRGFISGAGETELQLQRRRILERRSHLLAQIEEVRRTRALQRASRKRRGGAQGQGLATVAVVGYTNAGKSTLVNALSDSDLYSDDRLFATVDPRLRNVILPSGRKVLLSDTVGFISDLPVQLVEAFHATLEEVVEADLLVHVIDSSAPNHEDQRTSVLEVLQQIGVPEDKLQNMVEVWNKIDLLNEGAGMDEPLDETETGEVEEVDGESEMSSAEPVEEEVEELDLSAEEDLEALDDQADSEDWNTGDEQDKSTVVMKSLNDKQCAPLVHGSDSLCQSQDVPRLETSAVMGIGLQELLTVIDEKLSSQNVVERRSVDCFDRKWRAPSTSDAGAVVEN